MVKSAENIVLVDMDGVLADFDARVIEILGEEYPHITPLLKTRTNFYLADDYSQDNALIVREITNRPGFFRSLPVIEGALEGWERIQEAGCTPQICTSPLITNPNCAAEKYAWIAAILGETAAHQAIITRDKFRHPGRALIEDRPELRHAEQAVWRQIVFDMPYNKTASSSLRLFGWRDPNLEQLIEKAGQP